jgi:hypothetical protein
MHTPAPLAVAVEVRVLDAGTRVDRVWRTARLIGEDGLILEVDLPYEPRRPVHVSLRLPDELGLPIEATGLVEPVRFTDGERPRGVRFTSIEPAARERIVAYVQERCP